jgi:hypothetical protein
MHNLSAAKSTGICLSACIDPNCFEGMLEPQRDVVGERKIILKLHSRTPSLLQDCTSLPALLGLTMEARMNFPRGSAIMIGISISVPLTLANS